MSEFSWDADPVFLAFRDDIPGKVRMHTHKMDWKDWVRIDKTYPEQIRMRKKLTEEKLVRKGNFDMWLEEYHVIVSTLMLSVESDFLCRNWYIQKGAKYFIFRFYCIFINKYFSSKCQNMLKFVKNIKSRSLMIS